MTRTEAALRWARRAVVFVMGASVTLAGLVMIFTPGPATVVVPLGLMILATEFVWARLILNRLKAKLERVRDLQRRRKARRSGAPAPPPTAPTPDARSGTGPG